MRVETKATIDDEIYFMQNNKVAMSTVKYIKIEVKEEPTPFGTKTIVDIVYQTSSTARLNESQIFLTKQALLDSL